MPSIGCCVSAGESSFLKIVGLPTQGLNPGPLVQQAGDLYCCTTQLPYCTAYLCLIAQLSMASPITMGEAFGFAIIF